MNATSKKQLMLKSAAFCMLSFLFFAAGCAGTPTSATVEVVNMTGRPIDSLTVMHKYSNYTNCQDTMTWTNIATGATNGLMKVNYRTGFGTLGQDWWIVTWVNTNGLNITAPNNFRQIIDPIEQILAANDTNKIVQLITTVDSILKSTSISIPADVVGSVYFKLIATNFFNSEPTVGYKKHYLTGNDTKRVTSITIYPEGISFPDHVSDAPDWTKNAWWWWYGLPVKNAVVFTSISGYSVTVYNNFKH